MEPFSYLSALRRLGFRPTVRYPWAIVGRTQRVQGWKLHLSSVQVQARDLLEAVVPILREERVGFKVAQHDHVLALLNEGEFGPTQIGKFVTIYPRSDEHARRLADRLIARTTEFTGPRIVTDHHLGSVVYARHGSFSPVIQRDRLGQAVPMIEGVNATLVPDRYTVPFVPPTHVRDPFDGLNGPGRQEDAAGNRSPSPRIIGGYLVLMPISMRPYGGAFLAIDLRSRDKVALKVLKFGRPHCLSDREGRDIRDRLKRQAWLHADLSTRVAVPAADEYFEIDGYGYVAFEHIEGHDFEHLVGRSLGARPWHSLPVETQRKLLRCVGRAIDSVRELHAAGYIHRDLSPSNLWLGKDGNVYLLDLELAYAIGGSDSAFGLGTAGFMSPQQLARAAPSAKDDVFAIGSVLTFLLTRLDPRRVVFASDSERRLRLGRLAAGVPATLLDVVCACLHDNPDERPTLAMVGDAVGESLRELSRHRNSSPAGGTSHPRLERLQETVERGQARIMREAAENGGLWRSIRSPDNGGRAATVYDVERYANRGVAGVVFLLARLARFGYGSSATKPRAIRAARWLMENAPTTEALPGLHFGEAGVAVAIAEIIAAGYLLRDRRVDEFLKTALNGKLDWPDITHGAAGQGIAALYCGERLRDPRLAERAHACVDFLLATQASNGSWKLPAGVDGMSGQTLTGFAHGTAGIAFFLAEYAHRFDRPDVQRSLASATAWLVARAHRVAHADRLEWSYGTHTRDRWHWWCHGGPGIALTFLKLYEYTRDARHADVARRALRAHPIGVRHPNLTQCHGVSGLGEIYLEAARVLGEEEWKSRATDIADDLISLAREEKAGGLSWLAEDPYLAAPDLMVGYGGILHFLLRTECGDRAPGYPLLLDPSGH